MWKYKHFLKSQKLHQNFDDNSSFTYKKTVSKMRNVKNYFTSCKKIVRFSGLPSNWNQWILTDIDGKKYSQLISGHRSQRSLTMTSSKTTQKFPHTGETPDFGGLFIDSLISRFSPRDIGLLITIASQYILTLHSTRVRQYHK